MISVRRPVFPACWIAVASMLIVFCSGGDALAQLRLPSADAKACKLLPMADLESHYGSKPARVSGTDGASLSVCTATFGSYVARVESAPAGSSAGLPTSVASALQGVKDMLASSPILKLQESKDFGKVGCYSTKLSNNMGGSPEVVFSTVCLMTEGGYLNFTMSHSDPVRVTFELVKAMLEKTAKLRT
ncbi:MAG: hypothetical protein KF814_04255 [Nitrospiraceae bacterium]|nr:hypothetical protein [Nitrospiraceae bacterium]